MKLTAAELKQHEILLNTIRDKQTHLQEALDTFNQSLTEATAFAVSVQERLQEDFDVKSEKWQQGDAGDEAQVLIETWESFQPNDVEVSFDVVDEFEQLVNE